MNVVNEFVLACSRLLYLCLYYNCTINIKNLHFEIWKKKKLPCYASIAAVLERNRSNRPICLLLKKKLLLMKLQQYVQILLWFKTAAIYYCCPLNCCAAKTVAIGHFLTAAISIYSTSGNRFKYSRKLLKQIFKPKKLTLVYSFYLRNIFK